MAGAPKRKWLQVHLSTAVLLMFAAGGLVWMNVRADVRSPGMYYEIWYGWPRFAAMFTTWEKPDPSESNGAWFWFTSAVVLDIAVALAILFAVWFVCERWIAWRAGRKKG